MTQLDGINGTVLQRVELAYSGGSYKFNVNPQNIKYEQPHRVTAVKTQEQYVIEDFNADVQTITIAGNTAGPRSGAQAAILNLWNFLDAYANGTPMYGQAPKENLIFYNHTDDIAWEVTLAADGYNIERDVARPLMWDYEMKFIVIGLAGNKASSSAFTNDVTSWLYDREHYDNSNSTALSGSEISQSMLSNNNSTSFYNQSVNYPNMNTGKLEGTVQYSSESGITRAKEGLGIN